MGGATATGLRRSRARIDGILLLDKPVGITSNAALVQTQDPAWRSQGRTYRDARSACERPAADLLWGGHQVRRDLLLDADKTYEAVVALGAATTTGDAEGEVVFTGRRHPAPHRSLETVLRRFIGEQTQTPPMYSALKHKGRPAVRLRKSRRGGGARRAHYHRSRSSRRRLSTGKHCGFACGSARAPTSERWRTTSGCAWVAART